MRARLRSRLLFWLRLYEVIRQRLYQAGDGVLGGFDVSGETNFNQRRGGDGANGGDDDVFKRLLRAHVLSKQCDEVLYGGRTSKGDGVRPARLVLQHFFELLG